MTVEELIEHLSKFPPDKVVVRDEPFTTTRITSIWSVHGDRVIVDDV